VHVGILSYINHDYSNKAKHKITRLL
jgi:hypothetical protein